MRPTILRSGSFQLRRKIILIPEKKDRALAVPRSWPRHGRVQSRGSTAHDHATRLELSCDLRAASHWGVLHVCHRRGCQPVASACVCAAACCRGPSQAGVGFEPPLAIPRTGKVAVAKPSHFSLAAPCCPAHLVVGKPGRPYLDVVRRHLSRGLLPKHLLPGMWP